MKNLLLAASLASALVACATIPPEQLPITDEKREFTYDYTVAGKSQSELYKSARNYLATAYGDSRAVSRVEDEAQGTIIGKGVAPWGMTTNLAMIPSIPCSSHYDVIFLAKDGRARLQLALKDGVVASVVCGWALPPKRDYPQIVAQFERISSGLGKALNGQAAIDTLRDF